MPSAPSPSPYPHPHPQVLPEYSQHGHAIGTPGGHLLVAGGAAAAEGFDKGHQGMRLDDFVAHPLAVAAGLKRAHVLALRLYSTSIYRTVNKPLHDGCSPERPHPYPALVANLTDALKRLRQAAVAASDDAHLAQRTLWRAVSNIELSASEFKQRGATEISVLSTTKERAIAEQYAARAARSAGGAPADAALLLKLRVDSAAHIGAPLSWCSVRPSPERDSRPCAHLNSIRARGSSLSGARSDHT